MINAGISLDPPQLSSEDIQIGFANLHKQNIGFLVIDYSPLAVPSAQWVNHKEAWRQIMPFTPVYEDEYVLVYRTDITP